MRRYRNLQMLLPPLLAALVVGLFWLLGGLLQGQANERLRESQLLTLGELRGKLEGELNASLNLTAGLVAYVSVHGEIAPETFEAIAARLFEGQALLRNITLAPDNVVRHVYPLQGNEAVVGLDLLAHEIQGHATRRMMQSGQPVLAGPVRLVQGGRGLIHRVPIYVKDHDEPAGAGRYWGLMSTPIDYDRLLEAVGIEQVGQQMALAIRGTDGLGERGMVFHGDASLFDQPDTLLSQVRLPNGSWQLAARPLHDSSAGLRTMVRLLQAGGILLGGLVALFSWHLLRQGWRLRDSERRYRELAEHIQDVIFQTDIQRRLTYLSPAWAGLSGGDAGAMLGEDWVTLLEPVDRPQAAAQSAALIRQGTPSDCTLGEFRLLREADEPLWVMARAEVHRDSEGKVVGLIGTLVDISEHRASAQQIRHLSMHDNLTGLPNRPLLQDRFAQIQARLLRQNWGYQEVEPSQMALLSLQFDGLKVINERHGHDAGDRLLRETLVALKALLRDVDTLARLGGNEFALLLECRHRQEDAIRVAEKLLGGLLSPCELDGSPCQLGLNIGIALYPQHGTVLDELLIHADKARQRASLTGVWSWQFYDPAMER